MRCRGGMEVEMGIVYKQGDILESQADAIVIPVNCKGVWGAGLALDAKRKWPLAFREYRSDYEAGVVRPGRISVCRPYIPNSNQLIFAFPTKDHWREPSRLIWIHAGLTSMVTDLAIQECRSVAVPPLGCGLGGLAWADVRPLIEQHLSAIDGLTVEVYEPASR